MTLPGIRFDQESLPASWELMQVAASLSCHGQMALRGERPVPSRGALACTGFCGRR